MQNYRPASIVPPAVKTLLIINVVMWVLDIVAEKQFHIDLGNILGLHLPQAQNWGIWQYVTHMFMHASVGVGGRIEFTHLFFNMFALYMFGRVLENVWGSKRFVIFYLVCGIGAGVLNSLVGWFEVLRKSNWANPPHGYGKSSTAGLTTRLLPNTSMPGRRFSAASSI